MSESKPLDGVHFTHWRGGFLYQPGSQKGVRAAVVNAKGGCLYWECYQLWAGVLASGTVEDSVTEARRALVDAVIELGATVADGVRP